MYGKESRLIVSHPYGYDGIDALQELGLGFLDGGQERSWYSPGNSYLFVVGYPETLEAVDLTYQVPAKT